MKERIKQARLAVGLSQKALAEKIGISDAALSKIESGLNNPSKRTVNAISMTLGISIAWLETGEGDMYEESASQTLDAITVRYNGSTTFRAMLDVYSRLSSADQDAVERYIALLADALAGSQSPEVVIPAGSTAEEIVKALSDAESDAPATAAR